MTNKKLHTWRMCSIGAHWVKKHRRRIRSKGEIRVILIKGHCRQNHSKKDQLYVDEIRAITDKYFKNFDKLISYKKFGFQNGDSFDSLVSGWTKYWNDVLQPKVKIDPNLIKFLIATESSFRVDSKTLAGKGNWARGLLQITDQTISILKDEKGELKNFLVNVNQNNVNTPTLNICAGIRWLFQKQKLASLRLKREATWFESILEYKSYLRNYLKKKKLDIQRVEKLRSDYEKYSK